jgi:hypothetical protein
MKNWTSQLKIAVANQDIEAIVEVSQNFPENFDDTSQLIEAIELYKQAIEILNNKKDNLNIEKKKLQDIKKYINL